MAWYYGTFSCGHEGRTNIIGPQKNREWIKEQRFKGLCPDCYKKKMEEEREEANRKAEEKTKEMELPKLTGTEKQIAWAIKLRIKFIDEVTEIADTREERYFKLHNKHSKRAQRYRETLNYIIEKETSSKFYIDNRIYDAIELIDKYKEEYNNGFDKTDEINQKEIESENVIKPTEVKHDGIAKVDYNTTDNTIIAEYEKDETFIKIVKSLNFKWQSGTWRRKINEYTGTFQDRMAELGNELLKNGFIVSIIDEEAKEKAINGTYKQECNRWIQVDEDKLAIKWYENNSNIYNASRKLPSTKWKSNIKATVIDVSHFKEVEEFAEMYGFEYSKAAIKLIDSYKKKIEGLSEVEVISKEKEPDKDGLQDILNSSREILDDLKED